MKYGKYRMRALKIWLEETIAQINTYGEDRLHREDLDVLIEIKYVIEEAFENAD